MPPVKAEAIACRHHLAREAVFGVAEGCAGLGAELETTVDQALIIIRGLVTAFRVSVSGLSSI
jgi:hypothetical protein